MDLLTLSLTSQFLRLRSVRETARKTGRSPSTVSSALARTEAAIVASLVRREGANIVLTLEAELRAEDFAAVEIAARNLMAMVKLPEGPTPPVRIETLVRFLAVAQAGSIRSTAKRLGIGQPQLTRQMANLERMLGAKLLDRTKGGVTLTAAGQALLEPAEQVIDGWAAISRAAPERFRREISTWRIGAILPMGHESGVAKMLAHLIASWSAEPGRHLLRISSHTADELMIGLKTRRFDLVVLDHVQVPREFHSQIVAVGPLALFGRSEDLHSDNVSDALRRLPLALPSGKSGIRQETMAYLKSVPGDVLTQGVRLVEVDSIPVIINLVIQHGYLSVLPLNSIRRLPFKLNHVSLAPQHMQRLVIAWRRSGLPDDLLNMVRSAFDLAVLE